MQGTVNILEWDWCDHPQCFSLWGSQPLSPNSSCSHQRLEPMVDLQTSSSFSYQPLDAPIRAPLQTFNPFSLSQKWNISLYFILYILFLLLWVVRVKVTIVASVPGREPTVSIPSSLCTQRELIKENRTERRKLDRWSHLIGKLETEDKEGLP